MNDHTFEEKFGPWALVTGASSGIGTGFAQGSFWHDGYPTGLQPGIANGLCHALFIPHESRGLLALEVQCHTGALKWRCLKRLQAQNLAPPRRA